jgi:hypothetical protein
MKAWMDLSKSEECLGVDCCEHGNEPLDCVTGWRFRGNLMGTISL